MQDLWSKWLLHRRHGGNAEALERTLAYLTPVRDRVLAEARIADGETLLDIGTGDGLIAFKALDQVGEHGTVIFSDVSQDLLDHCEALAQQMGVSDRCRFLRMPADDLSPLEDESVDVVKIRSVLIYVAAKIRALNEFFRVLRPGGRLSLFEPINRFGLPEPPGRFWGFDVSPVQEIADVVREVYEQRQPPDTDPMMDFDERDLIRWVEQAGFGTLHLEFRVDIEQHEPRPWEQFVNMAFNPRIPSLNEAMAEVLTPEQTRRFADHLRPLVERGQGGMSLAIARLWATKG
jgi:ubiquinone/menaquinone biosynthesis C-methylase UbiE